MQIHVMIKSSIKHLCIAAVLGFTLSILYSALFNIPALAIFTPSPVISPKPITKVVATQMPTPSPTPTLVPTISSSILPTLIPKPAIAAKIVVNKTPSPPTTIVPTMLATPIPSLSGLKSSMLFSLVNNHRKSMGLTAFVENNNTCSFAQIRAPQVGAEIAGGYMHSGFSSQPHPGVETENIISYNNEQGAFNWWINDTIHKEAIEGNYTYSCLACSGYSCAEEFGN